MVHHATGWKNCLIAYLLYYIAACQVSKVYNSKLTKQQSDMLEKPESKGLISANCSIIKKKFIVNQLFKTAIEYQMSAVRNETEVFNQ